MFASINLSSIKLPAILMLVFSLADAAISAAVEAQRPAAPFKVRALAEIQSIYDDNVYRLSAANLRAFRSGDPAWKAGMESPDDLIVSPRLTLDLSGRTFGAQETAFRLSYTHLRYTSNADKSSSQWLFRLRQRLRAADVLEVAWVHAPPAYIRHLAGPPTSRAADDGAAWLPFEGARESLGLAYMGRLSRRVSYRAEFGRVWRFYNRPFLANDSREWGGSVAGTIQLTPPWSFIARYGHGTARAQTRDTETGTQTSVDVGDPSYARNLFQGTLAFTPRPPQGKVSRVEFTLQQDIYRYTSDLAYADDPAHAGRRDVVTAIELKLATAPVVGPATLQAGWRHTRSTSTWEGAGIGADGTAADNRYADNRIWLGLAYPF